MIIEKYEIDSTKINLDDSDIVSEEKNNEIIDILFSTILKKFSKKS